MSSKDLAIRYVLLIIRITDTWYQSDFIGHLFQMRRAVTTKDPPEPPPPPHVVLTDFKSDKLQDLRLPSTG